MLYSRPPKISTSELNYHTKRCQCGLGRGADKDESKDSRANGFFNDLKPATKLSGRDKKDLNRAITQMVLSSLRPYELANEPFLGDLLIKAMEVGARHGTKGCNRFDILGDNKLISGNGVRQNLDKVYEETTEY